MCQRQNTKLCFKTELRISYFKRVLNNSQGAKFHYYFFFNLSAIVAAFDDPKVAVVVIMMCHQVVVDS